MRLQDLLDQVDALHTSPDVLAQLERMAACGVRDIDLRAADFFGPSPLAAACRAFNELQQLREYNLRMFGRAFALPPELCGGRTEPDIEPHILTWEEVQE